MFSCFPLLDLILGRTKGVGSRFHVLCAQTHFRRYRGRRLSFSCFARLDSFSTVPRASGTVFPARTHFRRYRGCPIPFSCFARPDSFSAVSRASGTVFMFCLPGIIFDGTEGVSYRFHVFRSEICFRRYRGRRVLFSCFTLPDIFSSVTEGVASRFHVFLSRICLRWYRGRRVPFSCFALPGTFSDIPSTSGRVFMFCVFGLVFDGTEGVGSRAHVSCSQTRFRRYWGRRVPFSCFALLDSFSEVPGTSGPVFLFCAP
jgi:hypothetical protein